jgi:prolyl-tRNA editing enzyme YbaK/EbsC (Cys-tRNA(Pro) deacylase)
MTQLPASARRVAEAAEAGGYGITIVEYPDGTRTAYDAARAVGCAVEQIVKSMIFTADDELVLALTSGAHQVDPVALAAIAGRTRCGRANPDQVRTVTGYAIGGVPPFGHDNPVRTWIDPLLMTFAEVWAAAGTPRHVFAIVPEALVRLSGAVEADFVEP